MAAVKETIYKGTNINPHHLENWNRLAEHASMKPNSFLRFLLENLDESDVDRLLARL